jgi:1-deoxy-D-xylulose-5-phosphate reductoisomerase
MKKVALLGSTGSIGRSALEVLDCMSGDFEVYALSAREETELLCRQAVEHRPAIVCIGEKSLEPVLAESVPAGTKVVSGDEGLALIASLPEVDIVVNGLAGSVGFRPTLEAVRRGKRVALANKETLVSYGSILMPEAQAAKAEVIPVDSEHSAIHQAIGSHSREDVSRVILTASGGPFRNLDSLDSVTPDQALAHPTWEMGSKVTIDSATLMNKGLEMIEARWLFDIEPARIEVVIHPQSIVHSMVEFIDGSCIAQLATPDMKLPIQYALTYPRRGECLTKRLDLADVGRLDFSRPDFGRFPCLGLAYRAIEVGGTMPAVLSASDEVAVSAFLDGNLGFTEIPLVLEEVTRRHTPAAEPSLELLEKADAWSREETSRVVKLVDQGKLRRA